MTNSTSLTFYRLIVINNTKAVSICLKSTDTEKLLKALAQLHPTSCPNDKIQLFCSSQINLEFLFKLCFKPGNHLNFDRRVQQLFHVSKQITIYLHKFSFAIHSLDTTAISTQKNPAHASPVPVSLA